jgi:putative ABC transport system permease protein
MLKNYLKIAFRNLRRKKVYSIINILGLSIGIASSILIFLWVSEEMSYDRFHKNGDRIYRVIIDFDGVKSSATCGALAPTIKKEIPEISEAVRLWFPGSWQMYYGERNIERMGNYVDPSIFNIFTFPLLQGDAKSALLDPHSIVITESIAHSLFEDKDALGKTIYIRNRIGKKEPFTITGVMQNIPKNSHIQFDFLFSFNLLKEWYYPDFAERWSNNSFSAFVLVHENSNISFINQKISACYRKNTEKQRNLFLQPLFDVYLNANINNHSGGDYSYLYLFISIAFVILLIACINYMNLSTSYSAKRSKEIGLRKVVGANRGQIFTYHFFESLFYAFIALAIALLIVHQIIPLLNFFTGSVIVVNYLDPVFLFGILAIVLTAGVLSGYYPAVYLSAFKPVYALKNMGREGKRTTSLRMMLIVFQFMLTSIIIIATIVTSRQMNFIKTKDLGFEKENLVYTWTSGFNNDAIRQELLKNPDIVNVAGSGAQLDWIGWWQNIKKWDGHSDDSPVSFGILEVGYDFQNTYGLKTADGRFYSRDYFSDEQQAVVINENAVKSMHMDAPIGKTLYYNGVNRRIVGVVKDFHFESLYSDITPILFVLYPKQLRCLGIRVKQENIANTLLYIKKTIANIEPDYVLEYKFLDEKLNSLYIKDYRRYTLFIVFSLISIVLSCMGLFGLTLYEVEQRTKEIGVRKVLGASVNEIIYLISKNFLKWVLVSNILAWPIAWYAMNEWLKNFAFRIEISWWIFIFSCSIVLIVTLITVGFMTVKAAIANPVDSLKYE